MALPGPVHCFMICLCQGTFRWSDVAPRSETVLYARRNREVEALNFIISAGCGVLLNAAESRDADDLATAVEQRAAAVAVGYGGIGLENLPATLHCFAAADAANRKRRLYIFL